MPQNFFLIDASINNKFNLGGLSTMPKIGMEPIRRRALIDAAIAAIGDRGALDVTVSEIAGRAGVSTALAHHYFGNKNRLLEATMRALLTELAQDLRGALAGKATPRERLSLIVDVNFSDKQFTAGTVAAWLSFYMEAQRSPVMRHLLSIYARRLRSNLMFDLLKLKPRETALQIANGIAALIDGLYIQHALKAGGPSRANALALIEDYLDSKLGQTS
jgi:TetR/AcrR family transcriptional regulator, transcriptional repressor of bet genes